MKPAAVLFDFDGVIADTENVHVTAWQRTLLRMGWELTDEAAMRAAEIDDRAFLTELFAARKIEGPDIDGWIGLKSDLAASLLADAPRIYPGVADLVAALRSSGVRLGIVTTTLRRNVEMVLKAAGLTDSYELIVAKADVQALKPAPDGYRRALERLKLPASKVVAIEDSPTGLESARAAGLDAIAVGHRRAEGEWSAGRRFLDGFVPTSDAVRSILSEGAR
jgi:beta-phosphoglucomutase